MEAVIAISVTVYLIGYVAFITAATLDEDAPKTPKFISSLLLVALVWPIAFTMYVLAD